MQSKQGDIYTYLIEGKNKYTAFQVIYTNQENNKAVVLMLDYYQDTPADKNNIDQLKPFWCNHHSWEGQHDYWAVRNKMPKECILIGNIFPLLKLDEIPENISDLFQPLQITLQYKWLLLPEEYRKRYKEASKENKTVVVGGKEYRTSASRVLDETLVAIESGEELDVLPHLTEIYASGRLSWIPSYIEKRAHIMRLIWKDHELEEIDMSKTSLTFLSVSTKGVRKILLGENIETLGFNDNLIPSNLEVHQANPQQALGLHLNVCMPTANLKNLNVKELWISNIFEGDIELIFSVFPNLTELRIWGMPGIMRNMWSLSKFKQLKSLTLYDVFGFSAEEFPSPKEFPHVSRLWMNSVPTDAAKKVKKEFSKVPDINLWITKPRKDEWLEENMNNPFRNWDGDEHISSAHAKKAAKLYIDFSKQIKLLKGNTTDNIQNVFGKMVLDFTLIFNKMDKKKQWIETIEREHIADVLSMLLKEINDNFGEIVNISKLEDIFEATRDF